MPGCWVRSDGDWEWSGPVDPCTPSEFTVTEPVVIAELLGPDGAPISRMVDREPFGYRQRWSD